MQFRNYNLYLIFFSGTKFQISKYLDRTDKNFQKNRTSKPNQSYISVFFGKTRFRQNNFKNILFVEKNLRGPLLPQGDVYIFLKKSGLNKSKDE